MNAHLHNSVGEERGEQLLSHGNGKWLRYVRLAGFVVRCAVSEEEEGFRPFLLPGSKEGGGRVHTFFLSRTSEVALLALHFRFQIPNSPR